jgi:hypothetical protein
VKKKLLLVLSLVIALTMVLGFTVPALANVAPYGAGKSTILVSIGPPGTYKVGETIHYSITVEVPLTSGGLNTCLQTNNITNFTDPHGNVQALTTIPSLLPGEYVTFTKTSATYHQYSPQPGDPTRQALVDAIDAGGTMPVSPTYVDNNSLYAGPYNYLDYVVAAEDIKYDSLAKQYRVTAEAETHNIGGAHISAGNNNANAGNSISHEVQAGTEVSIEVANSPIDKGTSTTLTIKEENTGGIPLTTPHVELKKNLVAYWDLTNVSYPVGTNFNESGTVNGILDIDETWTWNLVTTGNLSALTNFQATGHGIAPGNDILDTTDITKETGYDDEQKDIDIEVNSPSTYADISADHESLGEEGGTVELTITEWNDGHVDLSNIEMIVTNNVDSTEYSLKKIGSTAPAYFDGGDTGDDGKLSVNEIWTWKIPGVLVTETTKFTVTGDGTYGTSPVIHVDATTDREEQQDVTVDVEPPHEAPASANWSIGLLIAGFAGAIVLLRYRKSFRFKN